jgi:hypothetical protein
MTRTGVLVLSIAAGLVVVGGAGTAIALAATSPPAVAPLVVVAEPDAEATPVQTVEAAEPVEPVDATTASLLFMIEEEKLAHDVYVTLGDLWGSKIFTNIADSESTHQDQVLTLLDSRAIVDPRSTEVGVFVNPDLQALYDQLVAQGSASRDAAMQVGIAIEEKDISDLAATIAVEDEADVIDVYERLLAASQKHLAAFERQA